MMDLFREFEARFPWLSSWFGDRLDIELPAFLVSLTMQGSCSSASLLPAIACIERFSASSRAGREITW